MKSYAKSKKMIFQTKLAVYTMYQELCLYAIQFGHKEMCKPLKDKMISNLTSWDLFVLRGRHALKTIAFVFR